MAFSFCASSSSPLFRSESVSESPEGARHGTATSPARAERNAWWEEKERQAGGVEGEWGGELDRIRSPVSAVATTGGLFAREHIRRRLLSSAAPGSEVPERSGAPFGAAAAEGS